MDRLLPMPKVHPPNACPAFDFTFPQRRQMWRGGKVQCPGAGAASRDKAKMGYLQGPVLGISCRGDTEFAEGRSDPILDLLREAGAMLCFAEERSREGKTERIVGGDRMDVH